VPIHDYVCESCGHVMEVVHGLHAEGPRECPVCGGPMAKAFAAPAVHFKGSGWAKKDRRSTSGPVKSKARTEGGGNGGGTDAPAGAAGPPAAAASSDASGGASGDAPAGASKEG